MIWLIVSRLAISMISTIEKSHMSLHLIFCEIVYIPTLVEHNRFIGWGKL